jgi:hypothetical protein
MNELDLSAEYYVQSDEEGRFQHGELYHISRNSSGGSVSTRVGMFHVWRRKLHPEGYFPHFRVDCYVTNHGLAPDPAWIARALLDTLMQQGFVAEPIWLEWHRSNESHGEARGEVFDFD